VDPRAGLDEVEKRKFFTLPGLELRLQPIASRCTDYGIPAPTKKEQMKNKVTFGMEVYVYISDKLILFLQYLRSSSFRLPDQNVLHIRILRLSHASCTHHGLAFVV
jgi:hypothetical protein